MNFSNSNHIPILIELKTHLHFNWYRLYKRSWLTTLKAHPYHLYNYYSFGEINEEFNSSLNTNFVDFFVKQELIIPKNMMKFKSWLGESNSTLSVQIINSTLRKGLREKNNRIWIRTLLETPLFSNYRNPLHTFKVIKSNTYLYFLAEKIFANLFTDNHTPLFVFRVQKINKQVQKFSKKKSTKYETKWVYLAPYKRTRFILQLFRLHLKLTTKRNLNQRIKYHFSNFYNHPNFITKYINFTHQHYFKFYKKNL